VLRGNSLPNQGRALAITSLLDGLAKPALPKFNEREHYLSLGLADSREYALLRAARRCLDGTRLKAEMLERNLGRVSKAATAAQVSWSAVRDLDKGVRPDRLEPATDGTIDHVFKPTDAELRIVAEGHRAEGETLEEAMARFQGFTASMAYVFSDPPEPVKPEVKR
jgi:hypothetical protein